MKIYDYKSAEALPFDKCVVALGFFDGVHRGHRALLAAAKSRAKELCLPLVVFSFYSETEGIKAPERLYSTEIKSALLEALGAEYALYARFGDISGMSACDFVSEFLIGKLGARLAVSGRDFRFGKGREGDTALLSKLMTASGGESLIVEDELAGEEKISTSLIKKLLANGRTKEAGELLAEPYFIIGEVVKGDGRGRSLGTPTVNISLQNSKSFLKTGVYHTSVVIDEKCYTGITNVGFCPTFSERERHTETFILGFSDCAYGKRAKLSFLDYLREEKRFSSKEELIAQINRDLSKIKE